jgi:hypothetical protein
MSAKDAQRLVSCRPAFAHVWPIRNACDDALCPYCQARSAADMWLSVESALFDTAEPRKARQPRFPFDLIRVTRTFTPKDLAAYVPDGQAAVDLSLVLADRLATRQKAVRGPVPSRVAEMHRLRPAYLGALDRLHVEPAWAEPQSWQVVIRQLFVVEPGAKIKLPGSKRWRDERPDRDAVARAVAWLHRYPREFLVGAAGKPADAGAAIRYLEARKGRQLAARCGCLRNLARPSASPAADVAPAAVASVAEVAVVEPAPVVAPVASPKTLSAIATRAAEIHRKPMSLRVATFRAPKFEARAVTEVLRLLDESDRAPAIRQLARDRTGKAWLNFPLLHEALDEELGLPVVFRTSRLHFDFDEIFMHRLLNDFPKSPMLSAYEDALGSMNPEEDRPLALIFSWPLVKKCKQMAVLYAGWGSWTPRIFRLHPTVGDDVYTIEPLSSFLGSLSRLPEDCPAVIDSA